MRLYPIKLRSIEDLEREKERLRIQKKELEQEEIFSLEGIFSNIVSGKIDEGNPVFSLLNFLPVSQPVMAVIKLFAQKLFSAKDKKEQADPVEEEATTHKKKGKSILRSIATEVLGGYLKWKAVQLSAKGVKHVVKTRMEKKARQ